MIRALLYLRVVSLRNRLISTLKRLRQPKYLIGAIVGAAYFYFFFFRRFATPPGRVTAGMGGVPLLAYNSMMLSPLIGALVILALVGGRLVLAWVTPEENPGLRFSEADICFLFPAPMSRRTLIQYHLLGSQFSILISSLFLTAIANRWSFPGGNAVTHAVGWWVILSTISLQFAAAPLAVAQMTRRGIGGARRRRIGLWVVALFLIACAAPVWNRLRSQGISGPADGGRFVDTVTGIVDVGPLHWVLAVFKIVLGPFLAPDWRAFAGAMGPALALLAAQYAWVVRMETSFEEGSMALAQRSAQLIAARREGRRVFGGAPRKARREPFRLGDRGWPEIAFLWKNLISSWQGFTPRTLLLGAGIIYLGCTWIGRQPAGNGIQAAVSVGAAVLAGYTLLLGPQYARQDLRSDLANADLLKSYPLPGWRMVLGELLAPVAVLGGLWWLELLTLSLAFPGRGLSWLTPDTRVSLFAGLGLVMPLVSALQLLAPNAGALLFPAWVQGARGRGPGIDAVGQRLIFMFGQILAILIFLLPAALAAAVIVFASQWLLGMAAATLVATAAVVVILVGEIWIGVWWLGECLEKFDPAST
jgi:hypothetical protein